MAGPSSRFDPMTLHHEPPEELYIRSLRSAKASVQYPPFSTEMMSQVTVAWVMPVTVVKLVLSYLIKKRTERVRIKD
jgi:hypothetical protein